MTHQNKLTFKKLFNSFIIAITGKENDFTSGSIRKAIFMLSIPMILEMMMESIFAVVDIAYVSQVSVNAVATIGLTESVITLVYAVAIGLSMAATAVVARRVGEKDIKGAREAAMQAIMLGVLVALIVGIIGILYAREILALMGGEPDLIAEGYGYTQWLIGGNITILLLFLINAIFRGAGDASVAMWTLVLSNGLNIILDPIFIFGWGPIPEYGVMGAGIATNIGRGTAVIFQLAILFFGWSRIKLGFQDIVVRAKVMLNLINVSLGGIAQFLIGTSSWVFLMRLMSEFGSEVLAGYTIAIRVMLFTIDAFLGHEQCRSNIGRAKIWALNSPIASRDLRVENRSLQRLFYAWWCPMVYLLCSPKRSLPSLMPRRTVVEPTERLCLQIIAAGYIFYAYGMVVTQAFNGAGDTKNPYQDQFHSLLAVPITLCLFGGHYL